MQVILRSGGCMQIGWALPSSCPSSRNLGVGDDDYSWAVDGMRSMKWHGNTSPVSSPYAHGVPYGRDWKWNAGDAIGCAVDLDAGVMSFRCESNTPRHSPCINYLRLRAYRESSKTVVYRLPETVKC